VGDASTQQVLVASMAQLYRYAVGWRWGWEWKRKEWNEAARPAGEGAWRKKQEQWQLVLHSSIGKGSFAGAGGVGSGIDAVATALAVWAAYHWNYRRSIRSGIAMNDVELGFVCGMDRTAESACWGGVHQVYHGEEG
jgi:hypothetical protein